MTYIIYQTEGVILGRKNFGEADKMLTVFTEKFGKLKAIGRGVRYLKSKLRYNLEIFSYSRFALVPIRDFWRIIDAEEVISSRKIVSVPQKLILLSRFAGVLNRMIQGEERNDFLWNEFKNIFMILREKNLTKEEMENLEISSLLQILNNLGYADKQQYVSKKSAISVINKAIKESML